MKRSPIVRKKPMARGAGPGRSKKRIAPRSKKTSDRDRYYAALRPMAAVERCQAEGMLPAGCAGLAAECHHAQGRGVGFMLNVATWRWLCSPCHLYVTDHTPEARELGLSGYRHGEIPLMDSKIRSCSACGRPMVWATTEAGKSIPLQGDREAGAPTEFDDNGKAGRIQLASTELALFEAGAGDVDGQGRLVVRVLADGEAPAPDQPIWLSHFVDCPHSKSYKAGRGL